MKIGIILGMALVAVTLAGCCPGTMLGNGAQPAAGVAHVDANANAHAAQAVDSDGDGIVDRLDRCPNTPKGCAVDEHGCPLDQDGDGVCDTFDKCPNTPHGARVNADGCSAAQLAAMAPPAPAAAPTPPPAPAAAPAEPAPAAQSVEEQLTTSGTIRLENVYFESNSARLRPGSNAPLDEAGAALAKYPALKVEVGGHTDSRGSAAYNRRLSQARAETVRRYLLTHFKLSPKQLTAKGYGSSQAETAGRTPEELQKDRRVVLRVLNPKALPSNVEVKH